MNSFLKIFIIVLAASLLVVSCAKKPLTLDEETSMKTLLKASDEDITDLVVREVAEQANLSAEDISVEYILRDEKSQAIAVKIRTDKNK